MFKSNIIAERPPVPIHQLEKRDFFIFRHDYKSDATASPLFVKESNNGDKVTYRPVHAKGIGKLGATSYKTLTHKVTLLTIHIQLV